MCSVAVFAGVDAPGYVLHSHTKLPIKELGAQYLRKAHADEMRRLSSTHAHGNRHTNQRIHSPLQIRMRATTFTSHFRPGRLAVIACQILDQCFVSESSGQMSFVLLTHVGDKNKLYVPNDDYVLELRLDWVMVMMGRNRR